ncbi:uncharacterized protein [Macrobrachium rosenbergii]|uniref:uncharacterized protein n=1 Tax=Macrobrachium rosenbergii TaxID=79674 RepID=UPI0034D53C76
MYRRWEMKVKFNRKVYDWSLIMADVTAALLGADFLTVHNSLADVARKELVTRFTKNSSPQQLSKQSKISNKKKEKVCPVALEIPPEEMRDLSQEYDDVFKDNLKHELTKPAKSLMLATDGSNMTMGGVLEQDTEDGHHLELLAFYKAVRHFHHMLEGQEFVIQTDHQPLVQTFPKAAATWSDHQQRHLSMIAEYSCTIKYLKGSSNTVAGTLSRSCANTIQLGIPYPEIAEVQKEDVGLSIHHQNDSRLVYLMGHVKGRQDMGKTRHPMPNFKNHEAHGEQDRRIQDDVPLPWPHSHQHSRPLHSLEGHKFLYMITDRNTRWPEAIPTQQQMMESCIKVLIHWVSRHGIPQITSSDRGADFTSVPWNALANSLGTKITHTTAYNNEANRIVERLNR